MDHKTEIEKCERWIRRATAALENPELMSKQELINLTYILIKRLLVKDNPDIVDVISM